MIDKEYDAFRSVQNSFVLYDDVRSILIEGEPGNCAPLVSIIIPTFRRPKLLEEAIRSALAQTEFADYEIIVVDNDSMPEDDATLTLIRNYLCPRMRYYRNEKNLGMTGNWNRGIQLARGQWVTLLHDDDWLAPEFLVRMFDVIPQNASLMTCRVLMGDMSYDPEFLRPYGSGMPRWYRIRPSRLILANVSPAPAVLIRRSLALELGGFDDTLYPCADYDFYIRASLLGSAYSITNALGYYRITESESYKGDTLERMISVSGWIKLGLYRKFTSLTSLIFYLNALRDWYQKGAKHHKRVAATSGLERIAMWISRIALASLWLRVVSKIAYWREIIYSR